MPTTTTDQDRAIEDLSIRLGGVTLKVEGGCDYTGEPDDDTVIVSWGDDPAEDLDGMRVCTVMSDGDIEFGGGTRPSDDPLELWATARNRMIRSHTRPADTGIHHGPLGPIGQAAQDRRALRASRPAPAPTTHWVIQRWDEDQSDTICEGVYAEEEKAREASARLAVKIASRAEGRVVLPKDDDGGIRWIVCYSEFVTTEPTDDEHHHAIWIQQVKTWQHD